MVEDYYNDYNINNLAINITKKIESRLIQLFIQEAPINSSFEDVISERIPGAFYGIRQCILDELKKYIKLACIRTHYSDIIHNQMTNKMLAQYQNEMLKRNASELVELLFSDNDIFEKDEKKDTYRLHRVVEMRFGIILLGKLKNKSN